MTTERGWTQADLEYWRDRVSGKDKNYIGDFTGSLRDNEHVKVVDALQVGIMLDRVPEENYEFLNDIMCDLNVSRELLPKEQILLRGAQQAIVKEYYSTVRRKVRFIDPRDSEGGIIAELSGSTELFVVAVSEKRNIIWG